MTPRVVADGSEMTFKTCARCGLRTRPIRVVQKRERIQALVAWFRELKSSQPCTDCRGFFHRAAMTYDHLPGTKKRGDVSNLLYSGYRQVVIDEIAKCELVYANCHAMRTVNREQAAQAV